MEQKNAGMQAHEEIVEAIAKIRKLEKEIDGIKEGLTQSLKKKKMHELDFISDAFYYDANGKIAKEIHVFYGIEKLAEQLGEAELEKKHIGIKEDIPIIKTSFTHDDVIYFELKY